MNTIWVLIVNFNGGKDTIDCIASLKKMQTAGHKLHVLVVDNASHDDSVAIIKKHHPDVTLLENKENRGFTGGVDIGISYILRSEAEYILLINNDTFVHENLLMELLKEAEKDNNGIVSPKIYFAKGSEYHKKRYKKEELGKVIWYAGGIMDLTNVLGHHRGVDEVDGGQYDIVGSIDFASGCCMLVKREVFDAIGIFDDRYFLYYEDSDFSERAKKAGFQILYVPKAVVWHKNASSAGGSGSALQDYYITRNRLLFGMKYAPLRSKVALIKESIKLLYKGRKWQKKGVTDFYFGKLGKGSYRI